MEFMQAMGIVGCLGTGYGLAQAALYSVRRQEAREKQRTPLHDEITDRLKNLMIVEIVSNQNDFSKIGGTRYQSNVYLENTQGLNVMVGNHPIDGVIKCLDEIVGKPTAIEHDLFMNRVRLTYTKDAGKNRSGTEMQDVCDISMIYDFEKDEIEKKKGGEDDKN